MKLIKRFALLAIVMISIQVYGQSDTTSPPQIDTIMYIHDSNRTTVVTIHPPSNKVEEKLDTCYSYVFVPRHYIPFSKGRWTRIESHWEIYDTLYKAHDVDPCNGYDDSEADLIFYIYSHESKTYAKFYHIPEDIIYDSLRDIIIQ